MLDLFHMWSTKFLHNPIWNTVSWLHQHIHSHQNTYSILSDDSTNPDSSHSFSSVSSIATTHLVTNQSKKAATPGTRNHLSHPRSELPEPEG